MKDLNTKRLLRLSGKAKDVFNMIDYLARKEAFFEKRLKAGRCHFFNENHDIGFN